MKKEKGIKKMKEIEVLDKGKNFDDPTIMIAICCVGMIIPLRA